MFERRHFAPCALAVLAFTLLLGCGGGHGSTVTAGSAQVSASDFAGQFDALWSTFNQNYSYFDYKHIDWDAARATFRARAQAARTEDQLVAVVKDMLGTLHDQHVTLIDPTGATVRTFVPSQPVNFDTSVFNSQYAERASFTPGPGGRFGFGFFNGVGYIQISSWNTTTVHIEDLDAAMENFRNTAALIVDVRNNGGGDDQLAYQFAGRFADATRTTEFVQFRNGPLHSDFTALQSRTIAPRGAFQFTRPVVLLIGRGCASSNESFIAAMRELPNVTVMGDTSAGASGNPGTFQLGGGWSYTVSRWIDYTAEKQVIEDQGIAPAIQVAASAADFAAGRDPVLDAAIARLAH
ncbi:MAG TPA: S41 family peptidase [Terriglobales bacterium]|nr:S41 family peptidase [Terriglobales bacterium]